MSAAEFDDTHDRDAQPVLDEQTESWGPAADMPIPFVLASPDPEPRMDVGVGPELSDASLADVLISWSRAAAGLTLLDHSPCAGGDCDRVLCRCTSVLCPGFVDVACSHGELLCDDCRSACDDCRLDARDDAGVS